MAQKAQKSLAARNVAILTRMHMSMAAVHSFFLICHFFFRRSLLAWFLISLPSIGVEIWFERISRPTYTGDGIVKELRRAGEDLEAKGLTEWMWDVVYWTWGCVLLAGVLGNRAFWLYSLVPVYSLWLAYSTFTGAKASLGALGGTPQEPAAGGSSKRQAKLEKRGGQRVQYR